VSVIRAANRLSSDFTPQFMPWCEVGLGPAAEKMPDAAFEQATGRNKQTAKGDLENITAVVQAIFNGPGFPTAIQRDVYRLALRAGRHEDHAQR
jgi:hypothetical protein